MNNDKVAQFLEGLIDALTFRRAALLAILATACLLLLSTYENRAVIFSELYRSAAATTPQWEISGESRTSLERLGKAANVGGVLVSRVDLKKNQRAIMYAVSSDPAEMGFLSGVVSKTAAQTLFDGDQKNTEFMVAMLNNEFLCSPSKDNSMLMRTIPNFDQKYSVVCRMAVPPYFGQFAGYLIALITSDLSETQVDTLRLQMNQTAIDLYLQDVNKKIQ
jgi:hypothetical protein